MLRKKVFRTKSDEKEWWKKGVYDDSDDDEYMTLAEYEYWKYGRYVDENVQRRRKYTPREGKKLAMRNSSIEDSNNVEEVLFRIERQNRLEELLYHLGFEQEDVKKILFIVRTEYSETDDPMDILDEIIRRI